MNMKKNLVSPLLITLALALTAILLVTGIAHAQTMDYNLNQAKRTVDSITSGLERLQPNDVNGFNRLVEKLNKAGELLQTSESKSHPDFAPTAEKWLALQQQMGQIAAALQQAQLDQQKLIAGKQAKQEAEALKKQQELAEQQRLAAEE